LVLASLTVLVFSDTIPEQIHLSYGNTPDEMVVTWSTRQGSSSLVQYGTSPDNLTLTASGNYTEWILGNWLGLHFTHRVRLQGLEPETVYFYRVVSGAAESLIYSFTSMQVGNDWIPKLLVYGDMGRHGGAQALDNLVEEVRSGYPTAVLHVGDFAYDLDSDFGINGDEFMNRIQPIAAYVPYMTCVGNHEDNYDYSHYINRFSMPGDSENMWYSFDMGNAHFIAYSTEVYFIPSLKYNIERQNLWLEEDLKQANQNRDKTPWIIAFGHRPFYCSNLDGDDCTTPKSKVRAGLEKLFYDNGVDIIIEAHEHSYERLWPVYNETVTQYNYVNPQAPVHLISGAAGCNENDGACINPIGGPLGPWSAFRSSGNHTYGFARLEIHNATHVFWEQLLALDNDEILDSIWIEADTHGPWKS